MQPILAFFSITYLLSWFLFIGAAVVSRDTLVSSHQFGTIGYILYLSGVFIPSIMALVFTLRTEGREGVQTLLRRIIDASPRVHWWLFAVVYMAVIKFCAASLFRIVNGVWPAFSDEKFYMIVPAIIFSTPFQAGEELGWRGFALPRLARKMGLPLASVILGLIWAAWHLPFFFIQGTDKSGQSFPVYALGVMAISIAMAWLYWRTNGSLLLMMLMHAAINNTTDIVPSAQQNPGNPFSFNASAVAWFTILLLWIPAVLFLVQMKKFSGSWVKAKG